LTLYTEQARDRYGKKVKEFDLEEITISELEREKPLGT
jgi:hypothetical protein